jgi:hypothetical protein
LSGIGVSFRPKRRAIAAGRECRISTVVNQAVAHSLRHASTPKERDNVAVGLSHITGTGLIAPAF